MDNARKYFAKKIGLERRSKGLTQVQLAEALGVEQSTVQRWEQGSIPEPATLARLASVLDCTVGQLLEGPDSKWEPSPLQNELTKTLESLTKQLQSLESLLSNQRSDPAMETLLAVIEDQRRRIRELESSERKYKDVPTSVLLQASEDLKKRKKKKPSSKPA